MAKKGKSRGKGSSSRFTWGMAFSEASLEKQVLANCSRTKDDDQKSVWHHIATLREIPQAVFDQLPCYIQKNPQVNNFLDDKNSQGHTPLALAIQASHFEALIALLYYQANVDRAFAHGGWMAELIHHFSLDELCTVLMKLKETHGVSVTIAYCDTDARSKCSIFETIVKSSSEKFSDAKTWVLHLLELGFLPKTPIDNKHPLHWLLSYDQTMAKNALAKLPVELVHAFNDRGNNVLFSVCHHANYELFRVLMDLHPHPHGVNQFGCNIAHILASATDSLAEVYPEPDFKLVHKLSNVILSQADGFAVASVLQKVIHSALRAKTDTKPLSKDDVLQHMHTNLHGLSANAQLASAKDILEPIPSSMNVKALAEALQLLSNMRESILLAQSYHIDLSGVDVNGNTPLMLACQRGNVNMVQCLLLNSSVLHYNQAGDSVLSIAVASGDNMMVDLLVKFLQKERPSELQKLVNGPCVIPQQMQQAILKRYPNGEGAEALRHAHSLLSLSLLSMGLHGMAMFYPWLMLLSSGYDRKLWLARANRDDAYQVVMALGFKFRDEHLNRDIGAKNCVETMLRYGVVVKKAEAVDAFLNKGMQRQRVENVWQLIRNVLPYLESPEQSLSMARQHLHKIPLRSFPVYLLEDHADVVLDVFLLKILESPLLYHSYNEFIHVISRYQISDYAAILKDDLQDACSLSRALQSLLVQLHNHKIITDCTQEQKNTLIRHGYSYGTDASPAHVPELKPVMMKIVEDNIPSDIHQATWQSKELEAKWSAWLSHFLNEVDSSDDGAGVFSMTGIDVLTVRSQTSPATTLPALKDLFFRCLHKIMCVSMLKRMKKNQWLQLVQALKLSHVSSSGEVRHDAFMVASYPALEEEKMRDSTGFHTLLPIFSRVNQPGCTPMQLSLSTWVHALSSIAQSMRDTPYDQKQLLNITIKVFLGASRHPKKLSDDMAKSSVDSRALYAHVASYIMQETGFWDGALYLMEWLVKCDERRWWLEQSDNKKNLLRYLAVEFEQGCRSDVSSERVLGALACFKKIAEFIDVDTILDLLDDVAERSACVSVFLLHQNLLDSLDDGLTVKRILVVLKRNITNLRCIDARRYDKMLQAWEEVNNRETKIKIATLEEEKKNAADEVLLLQEAQKRQQAILQNTKGDYTLAQKRVTALSEELAKYKQAVTDYESMKVNNCDLERSLAMLTSQLQAADTQAQEKAEALNKLREQYSSAHEAQKKAHAVALQDREQHAENRIAAQSQILHERYDEAQKKQKLANEQLEQDYAKLKQEYAQLKQENDSVNQMLVQRNAQLEKLCQRERELTAENARLQEPAAVVSHTSRAMQTVPVTGNDRGVKKRQSHRSERAVLQNGNSHDNGPLQPIMPNQMRFFSPDLVMDCFAWTQAVVYQLMQQMPPLQVRFYLRGSLVHCHMRNNPDEKNRWLEAFERGDEDIDLLLIGVDNVNSLIPWFCQCGFSNDGPGFSLQHPHFPSGRLHMQVKHQIHATGPDAANYMFQFDNGQWVEQSFDYQKSFVHAVAHPANADVKMTLYWALHQLIKQTHYLGHSASCAYLDTSIGCSRDPQRALLDTVKRFAHTCFRAALIQVFTQCERSSPLLIEQVRTVVQNRLGELSAIDVELSNMFGQLLSGVNQIR